MDQELKQKWIEALRSGRYKKGTKQLRKPIEGGYKHCCLGVLCDLIDSESWSGASEWHLNRHYIPDEYAAIRFGLPLHMQEKLIDKNDKRHWSFVKIADWIEKHL